MNSFERYLDSTFETIDVLKATDQSFVALVYDKHAQRLCTLKRRDLHSQEIYRTLKELDEPHIPELYRIFERDGNLIVVEEHIDGQTLDELLTYRPTDFDEKLALEILKQLCECLAVIHKADIVHRDIKPANIMLTKAHGVKLIDFGIARKFKPESRADTELLGTRGYASPEQFGLFDFGQTDARSDIYSLGVTIKQLLGEDYRGYLLKILNRCTALEPAQRYQSVAELLNALDNQRRLHVLKKFFAVGVVFTLVTAIPAVTTNIMPPAEKQPEIVTPAEEPIEIPAPADKTASTKQPSIFPQIVLTPPTNAPIKPLEPLEPATLPEPAKPKKNTVKTRESFDGVDMYLYLNGAVTGTNSNFVDINDWQSWSRYDNGVTFPAGWNARFHVENHGDTDLIDPIITVSIGQEKFSVQKSTVKVGQSLNLDIPLSGKFVAPINGVGIFHIVLQAQGKKPLYLNRSFRLIK